MFIVDTFNHRVQKYETDGTLITQFGMLGTANGEFNTPLDLAIDSQDNIFVTDPFNHRVQVFAKQPTNQPPIAEDQVVKTKKNKPIQIVLSANDVDGDTFTFSIVSQPSHGIITNIDESTGTLNYMPDKKFTGLDEFTFQATDSKGATSEIATVSIVVSNKMVVDKPSIDLDRLLAFIFKFIKYQLIN